MAALVPLPFHLPFLPQSLLPFLLLPFVVTLLSLATLHLVSRNTEISKKVTTITRTTRQMIGRTPGTGLLQLAAS